MKKRIKFTVGSLWCQLDVARKGEGHTGSAMLTKAQLRKFKRICRAYHAAQEAMLEKVEAL